MESVRNISKVSQMVNGVTNVTVNLSASGSKCGLETLTLTPTTAPHRRDV